MAIYHLSVQVISRSAGRSAVAAAAYRSGERLVDERVGRVYNYERKAVDHTEILAPKGAPKWCGDRNRLWNEVERAEKRVDSQLCRELNIALPKELSDEEQLKLARSFFRRHFVENGMVVDLAIHREDKGNPHLHALMTMREITPQGFGKKQRDWNKHELLDTWREEWQQHANLALDMAGHEARIDHRSHLSRGFLTIPGLKVGLNKIFSAQERRTVFQERLAKNASIRRLNGEAILLAPDNALKELTHHQATFSRQDVETWLEGRVAEAQRAECLRAILSSPEVALLRVAEVNEDDGREEIEALYSSVEMLRDERDVLRLGKDLHSSKDSRPAPSTQAAEAAQDSLTPEQRSAVDHVVSSDSSLALVVGYAGTGKSYMLSACNDFWRKQGRNVYGMALAGKAAEGLHSGAQIADCRSIAAWEYAWSKGKSSVSRDDVLVIDEAGMVGTRQMRRILDRAHKAGAKVVMVGDPEQLQAVEAGSPFRALVDATPKAELVSIRRQREEWQRTASLDLARGRTAEALNAYTERGCVHLHDTDAIAVAHLMREWEKHETDCKPESQLALAYRRAQVPELNSAIHALRKHLGRLGTEHKVETENGTRLMALGDRICFLKNSKKMEVRNGTLATIEKFDGREMVVRLDGPEQRRVTFEPRQWNHFDLGYAVTVAKSQGVTVDRAHVLASKAFDRHATNVAMTRHAERLDVYYSKEEFGRRPTSLGFMLSRKRHKAMALDHLQPQAQPQVVEKGVLPEHPEESRSKTFARTAAALRAAQEICARKPLSVQQALYSLEPVAKASEAFQQAARVRAWWRGQDEAYRAANPIKAKLGQSPIVKCPDTGQEMSVRKGLAAAEEAVKAKEEALESELARPTLRELAKVRAHESQVQVTAARESLPRLREEYESTKAFVESMMDTAPALENEVEKGGPER